MSDTEKRLLWIDDQQKVKQHNEKSESRKSIKDYISGGSKAKKEEFPFMAAIGPCGSDKGKNIL